MIFFRNQPILIQKSERESILWKEKTTMGVGKKKSTKLVVERFTFKVTLTF